MTRRYFSQTAISGPEVVLTGPEAHHLLHVMRAKCGEGVTLFDGGGAEYTAEIERLERSEVVLRIVGREEIDRELPLKITLAVALPKGERQKWLVEKAVELGVAALVPLVTERSVALAKSESPERLARAVIEAAKQCGRNRLMEITEPRRWSDFVAETREVPRRLLAHPGGGPGGVSGGGPIMLDNGAQTGSGARHAEVIAAVGPEGGFSPAEVALAVAAGWQTVGLGNRILRVETAALTLAAVLAAPFLR